MAKKSPQQSTAKYYEKLGSRIGYKIVMKRSQHFGYYDKDHSEENSAQQKYHEKIEQLLKLDSNQKVLDAGCGQGVVACFLASRNDVEITGITITPHEVNNATKRAKNLKVDSKTSFQVADYAAVPFKDNTFDRIYTTESLSHAVDVNKVISEFARILKPGGMIVCAEYEMDHKNFDNETMRLSKLVKHSAAIHGMYQFGQNEFATTITNNGFNNLKIYDWTTNVKPSFDRLRRLAKPFSAVVTKLNLENKFVNVTAAAMYSNGVEDGIFAYKVYVANK